MWWSPPLWHAGVTDWGRVPFTYQTLAMVDLSAFTPSFGPGHVTGAETRENNVRAPKEPTSGGRPRAAGQEPVLGAAAPPLVHE